MRVNNYILKRPTFSGDTFTALNVPISQAPWLAGQQEIIDRDFVDIEVENAINPVADYEKVRFLPKNDFGFCDGITYRVRFLERDGEDELITPLAYQGNSYWGNIGFVYDDFKFSKKAFTKSFLRLDFYDSDIGTSQRLLFFITLFPKFLQNDYTTNGQVPQPINYEVSFILGDVLKDRTQNGEGFYLYYFKEDVIPTVPKNLYMRATFANAKTGKVTRMMSSNSPTNGIDVLARTTMDDPTMVNQLYTRYILKRDVNGYCYEIDDDYSNNVVMTLDQNTGKVAYEVCLHEISAV
jgi:hypothetical protein